MEAIICQVSQENPTCEKFCCYRYLINTKYIYSCKAHLSDFRKNYSVNPEKFRKLLNKDQKLQWVKKIKDKIIEAELQINESTHKFHQFLKSIELFYYKQVLMPIIETKKQLKTSQINICETMTVNEEVYQIVKKGKNIKKNNEIAVMVSDILGNFKTIFPELFDVAFAEVNQRVNDNRAETRRHITNDKEIKELKISKSLFDLKLKNAEENEKKLTQKIRELKTKNKTLKNECNEERKKYESLEMEYCMQTEAIKETIYENNLKAKVYSKKQGDEKNKISPEKKIQPIRTDLVITDGNKFNKPIKRIIEKPNIDKNCKNKTNIKDDKFINESVSTIRKSNLYKSKSKKPENFIIGYDKQTSCSNKASIDRIQLASISNENNKLKLKNGMEPESKTRSPRRLDKTPTGRYLSKDSIHRNLKPYLIKNLVLDRDLDHNCTKEFSVYHKNLNPNQTRVNLSQREKSKKDRNSNQISPNGSRPKLKFDEPYVPTKTTNYKETEHLDYTLYAKSTKNLQKTPGREQGSMLRSNFSFIQS
ncbi:hypothetical protein SteCoe_27934 [Stentor coeruleus]|uniref:Uncharacterized protein n=1 Tax=Stentor coeruleus TaxID=5963 RepID=A0A1R2B9W3_9CILI|nr:hypothetical protein SteCoe_27934 [Stentor coeruleus]